MAKQIADYFLRWVVAHVNFLIAYSWWLLFRFGSLIVRDAEVRQRHAAARFDRRTGLAVALFWRLISVVLFALVAGDLVLGSHGAGLSSLGYRFACMSEAFAEGLGCGQGMSFLDVVTGGFASATDRTRSSGHSLTASDVQVRKRALVELSRNGNALVLLKFLDCGAGAWTEFAVGRAGVVSGVIQLLLGGEDIVLAHLDALEVGLNFRGSVGVMLGDDGAGGRFVFVRLGGRKGAQGSSKRRSEG
jgi:hypothetical protein